MSIEIYALCDPKTDRIRYVGQAKNAGKRLKGHISAARCSAGKRRVTPVQRWIRSLLDDGCGPKLRILEVTSDEMFIEAERKWIAELRDTEHLLNGTIGGDHVVVLTIDQRRDRAKKMNAVMAQRRSSDAVDTRPARIHVLMKRLGYILANWRRRALSETERPETRAWCTVTHNELVEKIQRRARESKNPHLLSGVFAWRKIE
jgi:hypothetical protein